MRAGRSNMAQPAMLRAFLQGRRDGHAAAENGRPRRRCRFCRPGAGDRAAPGAGRKLSPSSLPTRRWARQSRPTSQTICAPPRSRRRRGGCSRRSKSGTASRAQPILDMVVTDSKLDDAVRPTLLTFGGEVEEGEPFAHMVENRHLIDALVTKAKALGVELRATAVTAFAHSARAIDVQLADGDTVSARLLVGADGARSNIREQAGIATHGWNYDQSAIVTTVAHERDHNGRAEEHFLPAGPFAILPLTGKALLDRVDGKRARGRTHCRAAPMPNSTPNWKSASGSSSAISRSIGPRRAFPLGLVHRALVHRRAHRADRRCRAHYSSHRRAGAQHGPARCGGFGGSHCRCRAAGLDIGGSDVLERYQRWRRFDTMTMGVATDGLNRLFSNRSDVLRLVRDSAWAWSSACRRSSACSSARRRDLPAMCRNCCAARRCRNHVSGMLPTWSWNALRLAIASYQRSRLGVGGRPGTSCAVAIAHDADRNVAVRERRAGDVRRLRQLRVENLHASVVLSCEALIAAMSRFPAACGSSPRTRA